MSRSRPQAQWSKFTTPLGKLADMNEANRVHPVSCLHCWIFTPLIISTGFTIPQGELVICNLPLKDAIYSVIFASAKL